MSQKDSQKRVQKSEATFKLKPVNKTQMRVYLTTT